MISVRGKFDGREVRLLEPVPFQESMDVVITFLQPDIPAMTAKQGKWRHLKGSAQGVSLTQALLRSRGEDLQRE